MTEQELREKIVKILEEYRDWFIEEDYKRDIAKIDYTGIADALVAEGIGDVMEWKERAENFARAFSDCGNDLAEMEHLVEVAERALQYVVSEYRCDECPCLDCNAEIRGSQECIDCICEEYKKQAEKELQEERKDEQN